MRGQWDNVKKRYVVINQLRETRKKRLKELKEKYKGLSMWQKLKAFMYGRLARK